MGLFAALNLAYNTLISSQFAMKLYLARPERALQLTSAASAAFFFASSCAPPPVFASEELDPPRVLAGPPTFLGTEDVVLLGGAEFKVLPGEVKWSGSDSLPQRAPMMYVLRGSYRYAMSKTAGMK